MFGRACRMTSDDAMKIPTHNVQSTYRTVVVEGVSRSRRRNEAIPYPRFGYDESRIGRIALDLAPQVGDVHAQIESGIAERALPDRGEQLLVREDPPRIGHQHRQQLPLDRRQP